MYVARHRYGILMVFLGASIPLNQVPKKADSMPFADFLQNFYQKICKQLELMRLEAVWVSV